MEAEYSLTSEIKSEVKVGGKVYVSVFFFLLIYAIIFEGLKGLVHQRLMLPYYIFVFTTDIILTMPSFFNRKRKNYESIFIYLGRDRAVYRPLRNVSAERKKEILERRLEVEKIA